MQSYDSKTKFLDFRAQLTMQLQRVYQLGEICSEKWFPRPQPRRLRLIIRAQSELHSKKLFRRKLYIYILSISK